MLLHIREVLQEEGKSTHFLKLPKSKRENKSNNF